MLLSVLLIFFYSFTRQNFKMLENLFIYLFIYFKRVKAHLAIWLVYHVALCKTSTCISIQSTYIHVQDKNMHKNKKSITVVTNMYETGAKNVNIK